MNYPFYGSFLITSLLLHVTDEALNNFLDLYNPIAMKIGDYVPIVSLPVFTFKIWIYGLAIGIVFLFILTQFIYPRNRFILKISSVFAVIMIFNGLGHIIGSIYYCKIIPGMLSAPFLIASSLFFLYQCRLIKLIQIVINNLTNKSLPNHDFPLLPAHFGEKLAVNCL